MLDTSTSEKEMIKLKEIDCLLERQQHLREQLDEIEEKEAFALSKSINQNSADRFYRRLPLGWLDSVYCTRRDVLLRYASSTLSSLDMRRDVRILKYAKGMRKIPYQYYALLCESAIQTEDGMVLFLRDPYRRVRTQPIENIDAAKAAKWVGRILSVKVKLAEDQEALEVIQAERIKCLRLTRAGEIIDGKEIPIQSFLGEEFSYRNKVMGDAECRVEIGRMKERAEENGWYVYNGSEDEKFYTYFVKGDYMCGIFTKSGIIEMIWKDGMEFSDIDRQCIQALAQGDYRNRPLSNINCYNVLLRESECMCIDPTYGDL